MEFEEIFKQYLQKVERLQKQLDTLTEESTKTTLIMPFFSMLGYDVFDADEFMPEFTCDVATKKGESKISKKYTLKNQYCSYNTGIRTLKNPL